MVVSKPCYEKGEIISTSFDGAHGVGIWIGLYLKQYVLEGSPLPGLTENKLSEWILTCGERDDCPQWPSEGTVIFNTDNLAYGEYVISMSGDRGDLNAQAQSQVFMVDAHCPDPENHDWIPATETQQRSPCPFLNTIANHGFINRNGTFIDVEDMANKLELVYNVASEFIMANPIEQAIECDQTYFDENGIRRIDLKILFDGNCEEHEASMVRADKFFGKEESKDVDDRLLNGLLRMNKGENYLTLDDVFHYQGDRIADSLLKNPSTNFRDFDIGNMSTQGLFIFLLSKDKTLTTVEKDTVYFFMLEERLPSDFVMGALRDTPFNPDDDTDFISGLLAKSRINIETMINPPDIVLKTGGHFLGGN
eukprot:CAMPEP_0168169270 /NCGR_PEP_ID=MMETSP0139_2-20121125/3550_1 /TAXON_ID=44445 /ORGANISM="Pseudo-nitzschia australis, Strain 10249 10 AB" /LENGTH=364 /DNA_ID=CAMNT_0008086681 /DNA_START=155 /DNA_END=1249 /DNA_ORIENTATION=+